MLNETKILLGNIRNFRHFITEGVAENDIADAINNHKWIYLYYMGDDKTSSGYRTIRPYVLGTDNRTGKKVLRAWQDNPKNSWHFENRPTRKDSNKHDYWIDNEGEKPGWRLFRVDKISKILPTGKKFVDSNGLVMVPAGYHEGGDDNMSSVDVYVSTKKEPDFEYKYDKDYYGLGALPDDVEKNKWQSIQKGNKSRKQIGKNDIITLSNLANRFYKKSKGNYIVVVDDRNNYHLVTPEQIDRVRKKYGIEIPEQAILGSLSNLYNKIVKEETPVDTRFFDTIKAKTIAELKGKMK